MVNREFIAKIHIHLWCTINPCHHNNPWMCSIWTIEKFCNLLIVRLVVSAGWTPEQTRHAFQLVAIKEDRLKWHKKEIDGVRNFQKFIAIEVSSTLQSSPHRSIKKLLNDVGQLFTNKKNKFRYGNQQSRILANYKMPSEIGDMGNQDTKLTSVHSHICDYYLLNKT